MHARSCPEYITQIMPHSSHFHMLPGLALPAGKTFCRRFRLERRPTEEECINFVLPQSRRIKAVGGHQRVRPVTAIKLAKDFKYKGQNTSVTATCKQTTDRPTIHLSVKCENH